MNCTKNDIKRYVTGDCSLDETLEILQYMQTEPGTEELEKALDDSIRSDEEEYDDFRLPSSLRMPFSRITQKTLYHNRNKRLAKIILTAASFLLPVLISVAVYTYHTGKNIPEYLEVYVPKGEKQRLFFQDGTQVWLGADSRLAFPKCFIADKREVRLVGEAYFEVESSNRKPFIVQVEKIQIIVHGTGFNVKAYDDSHDIITTLDHGSITIRSADNREIRVEPNQQVSVNKENGHIQIRKMSDSSINSRWREGYVHFQSTSLRQVLSELSRQYNVRFKLSDPQIENVLVTISFQHEDLPVVLSDLQLIVPVQFIIRDREIEVKSVK